MNSLFKKIKDFFAQIPGIVIKKKLLLWIIFTIVTLFMLTGIGRLKMDASMQAYFDNQDPVRKAYDLFKYNFGSDELLYIVYEAKDGDVFSDHSLKAIQGIQSELINYRSLLKQDEISPLDAITDITTILNSSFLEAKNNSLTSRDFIGSNLPQTEAERKQLKELAKEQPDYPKLLFSDDFRYGGIIIETNFNAVPEESENQSENILDNEDGQIINLNEQTSTAVSNNEIPNYKINLMKDYVPFMKAVQSIFYKSKYAKHITFHPVGTPSFKAFVSKLVTDEMVMIALGALLLIIIVTLILFKSFSSVLWSVGIVITSLIWLMGTIGWSGVVMPDLIIIIVFFILTVGVADAVHILSGYLYYRNLEQNHQTALCSVYKKSAFACFFTSLTTAIGFMSFLFVPIMTMRKIGGFAALGVIYAFIITIVYLPLMLNVWNPVSKKRSKKVSDRYGEIHFIQKILNKIETLSFNYTGRIIIIFGLISLVLLFAIPKIRVESSSIQILRKGLTIRQDFELADDYMAGTDNLEILVDTKKSNGLKDPAVLESVDSLQKYLEKKYNKYITSTFSLADVTKDSFKALHNGDKSKYIIPENPAVLEQTLFMFNSANLKDRRRLVTDDYRTGRISIRSRSLDSNISMELMKDIDDYFSVQMKTLKQVYPEMEVTLTGRVALQMKIFDYLSWSQVISFSIALIVISIFLLLVLGSKRIGFIAIIPNMFPIIVAAGIMGYFNIPLDIHTLMILPIVIGISVDDTIHFLTHFRIELQNHGDPKKAIVNSMREVGQAIIFTSLVLSVGFLVFVLSKNMGFAYFGIINAAAIASAVIADLVLLPAVLLAVYKKQD